MAPLNVESEMPSSQTSRALYQLRLNLQLLSGLLGFVVIDENPAHSLALSLARIIL